MQTSLIKWCGIVDSLVRSWPPPIWCETAYQTDTCKKHFFISKIAMFLEFYCGKLQQLVLIVMIVGIYEHRIGFYNIFVIGPDKRGYQKNICFISAWKHMLWYSLEMPWWDTSDEYMYHNICFCGEIRKISKYHQFLVEKATYLQVWFVLKKYFYHKT